MAKATGARVMLHVYEPAKPGPSVPGFGVYHTGIEVGDNGIELCYAGGPNVPGSGVCQQPARRTPDASQWKYKESIDLGRSGLSGKDVSAALSRLSSSADWLARDYDVVHHNCNHYTAAVHRELGCSVSYPSHINRAATWGSFFLDNPIKDRQRKETERKAEEERKRNVFANSQGHSLVSSAALSPAAAPAAAAAAASSSSSSSSAQRGRANPWSGAARDSRCRRCCAAQLPLAAVADPLSVWLSFRRADPNFFPGGRKGASPAAGKK